MRRGQPASIQSINYSFVPNHRSTMEALARTSLTSQEWRVTIALLNQTDGYLRPEDKISIRFWQAITLMSRGSVHNTIKRLLARGLITSERRDDVTFYRVLPPNEWPTEAFHPQGISRKALSEATKLLAREKDQTNYLWLRRLLQEAETALVKNVSNRRRSQKRLQPETLSRGEGSAKEKASPTGDAASPTGDGRSPTGDAFRYKKVPRKPKESNKESVEGVSPSTNPRRRNAQGDPRVQEIALALEKERGYKSPNYGGEARAIKWMLDQGHSPEDILACRRAMKIDSWWTTHELFLMSVQKEIGQWVKAGCRPDAFERKGAYGKAGGYSQAKRPELPTREDYEREARRRGQRDDD